MPRPNGPSPVTLHDVAREAGVSLATASRAINGSSRRVRDDYRARVLAAAKRLNYKPNFAAQAVARGTTSTVGLLVGDVADPYFSRIAAGVIEAADTAGLAVTMAATGRDAGRELDLVRTMAAQRPRIMIVAGSRIADNPDQAALVEELTALERSGGRVIMISQPLLPFRTLATDNVGGARQLAEALVELGYRRFALLCGSRRLETSNERVSGFVDGLVRHGIEVPERWIVSTEFTRDGGYAGARELIERDQDRPELIFAVNDVMAVGAMSALRSAGLRPGRDIAVAGYDDIPTVQDVTPGLTTVRIPLAEIGREAVRHALTAATEPSGRPSIVWTASHSIVIRESTPERQRGTPRDRLRERPAD